MSVQKIEKLFLKISKNPRNVKFNELIKVIQGYGFNLSRIHGSHHIFYSSETKEILNIQEVKGEAKPYQIRQFIKIVEQYKLRIR